MATIASTAFRPVCTPRIHEEICRQVRGRLARGQLKPGDKLPPERELALEFGVSRGAVREALRTLENAGLVALRKGMHGGAFIRAGEPALLAQPLHDLMILGALSPQALGEARAWVSDLAVQLACERRTLKDLALMESSLRAIERSDTLRGRSDAAIAFQSALGRATHSPLWTALVESMSRLVRDMLESGDNRPRPELQPVRQRIVDAVRERDVTAARTAMRDYLSLVRAVSPPMPPALPQLGARVRQAVGPAPRPRTARLGALGA